MSRRVPRGLDLFAALFFCLGCRGERSAEPPTAPEFRLSDSSGRAVRLSDFRGRVVLLDFWATWCEPCHEAIPFFQALYERHRSRGFVVLGINQDAFTDGVPEFLKENRMTYPVALDPDNSLYEGYGVRGLPTTVILDGRGRIRERWVGFDRSAASEMERAVAALLAEAGA